MSYIVFSNLFYLGAKMMKLLLVLLVAAAIIGSLESRPMRGELNRY